MKKTSLLVVAGLALGFFQGCGKQNNDGNAASKDKLHLAFVANSAGEYWSIVNLGCQTAANQIGDVVVDFHFPAERTVESQQEIITNLVASGVRGIAISPIDAESQTAFLNDIAGKTLLACADSDAEQSKRVCYIGTDNVAAGKQAAELIKAALPEGGKIVLLVGYSNAQNTKDRVQGVQAGLAGSNIQIIDTLADNQNITVGQKNASDLLTKHSDLVGMVGISGYHGPALITAVRAADKSGKVKIVCFDDNNDTLAGIVSGDVFGTIAQNPFQLGKQTIIQLEKRLRGDKTQSLEGKTFTSSRPITKENVKDFQAGRKGILLHLNDK